MHLTLKDGSLVRLRPATNADGPALLRHVSDVLAEHGMTGEPEGADGCLADIERHYLQAGGVFEVVEDERGQLVGCYGLLPEAPGVCELRKMYLSSRVRGLGLGYQLLARATVEARARGFKRMELTTAKPLAAGVALYERYGFKPSRRTDMPARCDRALEYEL